MTQETIFVTSVHMKIREIKCCLQQMDELANNSDPSPHSKIPKIQGKIDCFFQTEYFGETNIIGGIKSHIDK